MPRSLRSYLVHNAPLKLALGLARADALALLPGVHLTAVAPTAVHLTEDRSDRGRGGSAPYFVPTVPHPLQQDPRPQG